MKYIFTKYTCFENMYMHMYKLFQYFFRDKYITKLNNVIFLKCINFSQ